MNASHKEFQIVRLGKADVGIARQLIALFRKVFEREDQATATDAHLRRLLENPAFVAYAALQASQVVGGLTAYELPGYYSENSEMFIYDIAVDPAVQRKGIGKVLLSALNEYCRQQGIREVFVAAHEEDTHALDFYQATGGQAEKVVHFTYTTL